MSYDYGHALVMDVRNYVRNHIDFLDFPTLQDLEEHLNEALYSDPSVTGGPKGQLTPQFLIFPSPSSGRLWRSFSFRRETGAHGCLPGKKTGILPSLMPCPIDEIVGAWYAI